jgi:hypothetical protein
VADVSGVADFRVTRTLAGGKLTVRDVEDTQKNVVVVSGQVQVFFETSQSSVSDVGSIDEREQILDGDNGDNPSVDLQDKKKGSE